MLILIYIDDMYALHQFNDYDTMDMDMLRTQERIFTEYDERFFAIPL